MAFNLSNRAVERTFDLVRRHPRFPFDCLAFPSGFGPGLFKAVNFAAGPDRFQQGKQTQNNCCLQLLVKGNTKVVPHHERKKHRTGRLGVLGDVDCYRG